MVNSGRAAMQLMLDKRSQSRRLPKYQRQSSRPNARKHFTMKSLLEPRMPASNKAKTKVKSLMEAETKERIRTRKPLSLKKEKNSLSKKLNQLQSLSKLYQLKRSRNNKDRKKSKLGKTTQYKSWSKLNQLQRRRKNKDGRKSKGRKKASTCNRWKKKLVIDSSTWQNYCLKRPLVRTW